jgi:hypothetical protein
MQTAKNKNEPAQAIRVTQAGKTGKLDGLPTPILSDDQHQDKRQALRAAYIAILSWPRPTQAAR